MRTGQHLEVSDFAERIHIPAGTPPIEEIELIDLLQRGHINQACSEYLALCENYPHHPVLKGTIHDTLLTLLAATPTQLNIVWLIELYKTQHKVFNSDAVDVTSHQAVIRLAIQMRNEELKNDVILVIKMHADALYKFATLEKYHKQLNSPKTPTTPSRLKNLLARLKSQPETKQDQIAKYINHLEKCLDAGKKVEIEPSNPLNRDAFVTIVGNIKEIESKEPKTGYLEKKFTLAVALRPENYPYEEVCRTTLESAMKCGNLEFAWDLWQTNIDEELIFINDPAFLDSFMKFLSDRRAPWHIMDVYTHTLGLLNADEERIATLERQNFQAFKNFHHAAMREMAKFPEIVNEVDHICHCIATYRGGKFADEKTFAITITALCHAGDINRAIEVLCDAEEVLSNRCLTLLHCELRKDEYQYAAENIKLMYIRMPEVLAKCPPKTPAEFTRMETYSLSGMLLAGMGLLPETDQAMQGLLTNTLEEKEQRDEIAQPAPTDPSTPKPALLKYTPHPSLMFQPSPVAAQSPAVLAQPTKPTLPPREFSFGGPHAAYNGPS